MDTLIKGYNNISKIIRISSFHVISKGDKDTDMQDVIWKISGGFYFDNKEELETFRKSIAKSFEDYCGEVEIVALNHEKQ